MRSPETERAAEVTRAETTDHERGAARSLLRKARGGVMSEVPGSVPEKQARAEITGEPSRRTRGRLALELVALRGKDVIGVRHLLDGGTAWVGNVANAIARVPTRDLGGHPHLVGEVRAGTYAVCIPPRARARLHPRDGVPRLMIGPHRVELGEGERAVLVLGGVQIRAQVVQFESAGMSLRPGVVGLWVAALAIAYAAVLVLTSVLTRSPAAPAEGGAIEREPVTAPAR